MLSAGFEPAIPATKWPQTYALDHAAIGNGSLNIYQHILNALKVSHIMRCQNFLCVQQWQVIWRLKGWMASVDHCALLWVELFISLSSYLYCLHFFDIPPLAWILSQDHSVFHLFVIIFNSLQQEYIFQRYPVHLYRSLPARLRPKSIQSNSITAPHFVHQHIGIKAWLAVKRFFLILGCIFVY
jgi:hypothetical protein